MSVRIVIIGHNQWEEYTQPLAIDILTRTQYDLTIVDNGSEPPYPTFVGKTVFLRGDGKSYARGINLGINQSPSADWYIVLNNDVILDCPFNMNGLDTGTLYGIEICDWYAVGWGLVFSRYLWETIGEFDDKYKLMFYDDLDYSYRVLLRGMKVEKISLPFVHLAHKSHKYIDPEALRTENRARFIEKFKTLPEKIYDIYRR